jgi:hypothetical protein
MVQLLKALLVVLLLAVLLLELAVVMVAQRVLYQVQMAPAEVVVQVVILAQVVREVHQRQTAPMVREVAVEAVKEMLVGQAPAVEVGVV